MVDLYIEFKTWAEGTVDAPWPFVLFEETDDYRNRKDLTQRIPEKKVQSVFLSFNEEVCGKFLSENVSAVILGAVISADFPTEIQGKLNSVFGICEILGMCEISEENKERIRRVMESAVS